MSNGFAAWVRDSITTMQQAVAAMQAQHQLLLEQTQRAPSITEEIDSIAGRRIYYNLNGVVAFTPQDDGRRGAPVSMIVSQDGSFVQTHYPLILWRPSLPANATNFGLWRPVSAFPLPQQAVPTSANYELNEDIVSISYEVIDTGSQRNFQNEPTPPIISRPDNLIPLSVPTLFAPNSNIQVFPTFESIRFTDAVVPPTQGILAVSLPGYRIVNM